MTTTAAPAAKAIPVVSMSDTDLEYWDERDNLHVGLRWKSEFNDGEIIALWTDDDARQMFEDGFFSTKGHILGRLNWKGPLHASVYEYCRQHGMLPARPWVQCADCDYKFAPIRPKGRIKPDDYEYFQCAECIAGDRQARPFELTAAEWRKLIRSARRFACIE